MAKKPAAKKPGVPSVSNYLLSDSTYVATQASLAKALAKYKADIAKQGSDYGTQYNTDLNRLGFDPAAKTWNQTDQLTSSGKAFTGQLNDFASRGMVNSSGYAQNYSDLGRTFDQQVKDAATAKQKYTSDLSAQLGSYTDQNTDALTQAKLEAISRRSVKYANTANGAVA